MGAPSETGQANSPGKWEKWEWEIGSSGDFPIETSMWDARAGGQISGSGTNCGATCVAQTQTL